MLTFDQIKEYFNPHLAALNPKGILTEYLQYELLDSIFKQPGAEALSFIGGTAIRIIHNSERFSEDLDFDNFGLSFGKFKILAIKACKEMSSKGFSIVYRFMEKEKHYHAYLRFPNILFAFGISPHKDAGVFLSVDTEKKKKLFTPTLQVINKFGVFRNIIVNPPAILLSQKLLAILFRKREKGRDFYDASFLSGKVTPDYNYIKSVTGLEKEIFIEQITWRCANFNFHHLAQDVAPFLFDADQKSRVIHFKQTLAKIVV